MQAELESPAQDADANIHVVLRVVSEPKRRTLTILFVYHEESKLVDL